MCLQGGTTASYYTHRIFNKKTEHFLHVDGIMHNWSNPFFGVLSNQALKVLTFLVNQAAEIKPLNA